MRARRVTKNKRHVFTGASLRSRAPETTINELAEARRESNRVALRNLKAVNRVLKVLCGTEASILTLPDR